MTDTDGRRPCDNRGRDWNYSPCLESTRNVKDCLKPPETRRESMEQIFLLSLQEGTIYQYFGFGLLASWMVRI